VNNLARLFWYGLTMTRRCPAPAGASAFSRRWYQRISQLSAALASCADMAIGVLGGDMKRRELLSARLGDAHSELFIACSILKYHDSNAPGSAQSAHAEYAVRRSLVAAQHSLAAFCENFPVRPLGWLLRVLCLPVGSAVRLPDDDQVRRLGELLLEPNPVRAALAEMVFVSSDPNDATGRLESTYRMLLQVDSAWQSFSRARSKGQIAAFDLAEALQEAVGKGIIAAEDVTALADYDAHRYDSLLTDEFDLLRPRQHAMRSQ
jgi:acyl-CoA dehydrogenase